MEYIVLVIEAAHQVEALLFTGPLRHSMLLSSTEVSVNSS